MSRIPSIPLLSRTHSMPNLWTFWEHVQSTDAASRYLFDQAVFYTEESGYVVECRNGTPMRLGRSGAR
ncbi:hypothetical protein O0I10_013310, partial [Lichtheimia ornata]